MKCQYLATIMALSFTIVSCGNDKINTRTNTPEAEPAPTPTVPTPTAQTQAEVPAAEAPADTTEPTIEPPFAAPIDTSVDETIGEKEIADARAAGIENLKKDKTIFIATFKEELGHLSSDMSEKMSKLKGIYLESLEMFEQDFKTAENDIKNYAATSAEDMAEYSDIRVKEYIDSISAKALDMSSKLLDSVVEEMEEALKNLEK